MDGRRQRTMNNPGIMGALTPSDRKNMGRQNLPFHSAQSMNRVTGAVQRPESFTNLNMLGRPDLSFRYSHMGPSEGMGVGGTGEPRLSDYTTRDGETIRGTWRKVDDARRADEMDEYGYLEGAPRQRTNFYEGNISPQAFNEMYGGVYDDAIFRTVDPNTNRIEQFPMARGMEQAAVDPSDWRTILRILEAGGDPQTETAGIMGAMPQERQMAELNERQRRALGTRVNRFAYDEGISSPQDMLKMISPLDKPSFFGFGGNEANEQDIIDFYKNNTSMVG